MENDLIGYFPYITEIARFDWLSFSRALQSEPSVQNLSLSFATIT